MLATKVLQLDRRMLSLMRLFKFYTKLALIHLTNRLEYIFYPIYNIIFLLRVEQTYYMWLLSQLMK